MVEFSSLKTDFEIMSEEYEGGDAVDDTPEGMPTHFYLVKKIKNRTDHDTSRDIMIKFFKSLPEPFVCNASGIFNHEDQSKDSFEYNLSLDEALNLLDKTLMNGVAAEGGLTESAEVKAYRQEMLSFDNDISLDELEAIYPSKAVLGVSTASWLYHYCEHSYFILWKEHCALFTKFGWD